MIFSSLSFSSCLFPLAKGHDYAVILHVLPSFAYRLACPLSWRKAVVSRQIQNIRLEGQNISGSSSSFTQVLHRWHYPRLSNLSRIPVEIKVVCLKTKGGRSSLCGNYLRTSTEWRQFTVLEKLSQEDLLAPLSTSKPAHSKSPSPGSIRAMILIHCLILERRSLQEAEDPTAPA